MKWAFKSICTALTQIQLRRLATMTFFFFFFLKKKKKKKELGMYLRRMANLRGYHTSFVKWFHVRKPDVGHFRDAFSHLDGGCITDRWNMKLFTV